ncbi:hypothetical protein MKW92_032075, partial [Papaver armeniacum]
VYDWIWRTCLLYTFAGLLFSRGLCRGLYTVCWKDAQFLTSFMDVCILLF